MLKCSHFVCNRSFINLTTLQLITFTFKLSALNFIEKRQRQKIVEAIEQGINFKTRSNILKTSCTKKNCKKKIAYFREKN